MTWYISSLFFRQYLILTKYLEQNSQEFIVHLPQEISWPRNNMLDRGASENTELTSRHYQTSPLVHWVLEIRYKISIKTNLFFNMTVFERLTKLKGFDFSRSALDLICSYLKKRQRVVIINNKMSSAETIITGFPQQVIDGSFFFFFFWLFPKRPYPGFLRLLKTPQNGKVSYKLLRTPRELVDLRKFSSNISGFTFT